MNNDNSKSKKGGSGSELLPKVLTNFVFDLFDSVITSQLPEEQTVLYEQTFPELSRKYCSDQPWPSPNTIASECNGDPLFLAIYRELTHRHWHATQRPSLRDRAEGWLVYKEVMEELLESSSSSTFYLLPVWTFDMVHEFVYQFQGYCQMRTLVYSAARKHGILLQDGSKNPGFNEKEISQPAQDIFDNLQLLEQLQEENTWDVSTVLSYLRRLVATGLPAGGSTTTDTSLVYTHLAAFSCVALSRLECLLGDYTASLQALTPLSQHGSMALPQASSEGPTITVADMLHSVMPARISLAYHAGISLLLLRRYKDALRTMGSMCATIQRGFKTGQLNTDNYSKSYERILACTALLHHLCPSTGLVEESVMRALRDKYGAHTLEASVLPIPQLTDEWFQQQCPKFIAWNCVLENPRPVQQQVQYWEKEVKLWTGRTLRSYLKLYTGLSVAKLSQFHDEADVVPRLLAYKLRMRQQEAVLDKTGNSIRTSTSVPAYTANDPFISAMDVAYHVVKDEVHIEEVERPRRFKNLFLSNMKQDCEVRQAVRNIVIPKVVVPEEAAAASSSK